MIIIAAIGSQSCLYIDGTDFFDKACSEVFPHFGDTAKCLNTLKINIEGWILVQIYPNFLNMLSFLPLDEYYRCYRLPKLAFYRFHWFLRLSQVRWFSSFRVCFLSSLFLKISWLFIYFSRNIPVISEYDEFFVI